MNKKVLKKGIFFKSVNILTLKLKYAVLQYLLNLGIMNFMSQDHKKIITAFFEARESNDFNALKKLCSSDIAWIIPGNNSVSGNYFRQDEVFGLFKKQSKSTGGTYRERLIDILTSEARTIAFGEMVGNRAGQDLETDFCMLFEFNKSSIITEVRVFTEYQVLADEFWGSQQ